MTAWSLPALVASVSVVIAACSPSGSTQHPPPTAAAARPQVGNDERRPTVARSRERVEPKVQQPAAETIHEPSPQLPPTICGRTDISYQQAQVRAARSLVFIEPKRLQVPLAVLAPDTVVTVVQPIGAWFQVEFNDSRWGKRVGFMECSNLWAVERRASAPASISPSREPRTTSQPVAKPRVSEPSTSSSTSTPSAVSGRPETVGGYLEWRRDGYIVVDGQSIRWDNRTRVTGGHWRSAEVAPFGAEVKVTGRRSADGALNASVIEIKRNGSAMFELEARAAADAAENLFLREGAMLALDGREVRRTGRIVDDGPEVERVKAVLSRLIPPYIQGTTTLRVHVVDTPQWNAMALPNGSIWVFSGLLNDLQNDDELASVLGHELAHFTHEHSRRARKQGFWQQLVIAGANAAIARINSPGTRDLVVQLGELGLGAWSNGYGRNLEDQADRVGLRYAYEAGYDVRQAIEPWRRLLQRQGEEDRIQNFFSYNHSRPSDRIRNIQRQIALNYP